MKHQYFSAFSGRIRTRLGTGPVRSAVALALLPALAWWSGPAAANPSGGVIVHGDVTIQSGGGVLNINQASANAIIDWEAFSIQAGELTRFLQPGTNAAVLNRVTGGNPSEIHGALQANGSVFVINPNGILVGAGGTIDVHGLVLSTLDVDNGEFLARGDMVFNGSGNAGVTNLGRINAIGGDVFLIGKTVTNSGSIHASGGTVGLAAGEEVLLRAADGADGGRIFVRATGSGVSGPGILNDGTIEGAAVELKAHGNHYALAINNKGSIRATGAVHSGGRVHLRGTGGSVANSGSIHATSSGAGDASILIEAAYAKVDGELRAERLSGGTETGTASVKIAASEATEIGATIRSQSVEGIGGSVDVESEHITVAADTHIDASGSLGGGSVRIGGGFQGNDPAFANALSVDMADGATIRADALDSGDGGTVVLWSDGDTTFRGDISATGRGDGRGGLVEISGKEGLLVDGTVSTLAENGANGHLLLDPKNLTISSSVSSATNINTSTLQSLVGSNHVVISTFDEVAGEAGHISVLNPVHYTSANSLTLLAEGNLYIGDDIINRGSGNVNLVAGWNSSLLSLETLFAGTATPHATLPGTSTATGDIDMDTSIFSVPGAFGHNGGSVYVGLRGDPGGNPEDIAADRALSVASRTGQTNVAGHDVLVWGAAYTGGINQGAQRHSQIGYNRRDAGSTISDAATGRIRVAALNDIEVISNKFEVGIQGSSGWNSTTDNTGNASYAQIGHGGDRDAVRDMQLSGEIVIEAGGNLTLLGGKAYNNNATIGHGGYDNPDDDDGTNLATLGGGISVKVGGNLTLEAGLGYHAHVQIGHGGGNHYLADFTESEIDIIAGGNVTVRGGAGFASSENNSRAQAQIGHGGYNADFILDSVPGTNNLVIPVAAGSGRGYKGDITVDAGGSVIVEAGNFDNYNLALIGNGGILADGDHSGDIIVTAGQRIEVKGGDGASALLAQIGHISYNSSNAISGDVTVIAADGGIGLSGGNSTVNYAAIGSGGYNMHDGNSISGGTYVTSLGSDAIDGIAIRSGAGSYAAAHIGHLAVRETPGPAITLLGNTEVDVTGGGLLLESSALGYFSHTMIGHGGRNFSGGMSGNVRVDVLAGNISLLGGGANASSRYNHSQIGHGGYGNGTTLTATGNITVETDEGNLGIVAGHNVFSYAQIGHGGGRAGVASQSDLSGNVTARASGDITATGGSSSYTYAQIGHGGTASNADNTWHLGGTIEVEAGGGVTASGGTSSYTYSQIGHGGISATATVPSSSTISASPIMVTAGTGDVLLLAGTASYTGAKIGHGNYRQTLAGFGESSVDVTAGRDIRLVSPQFETYTSSAYSGTQIGHGGFEAIVGEIPSVLGYSGDITATAGGKIDVIAGKNSGSYNWSLIGHNSYYNSSGIHSGNITVTAGTEAGLSAYGVTVRGASGDFMPFAGTNTSSGSYYSFASIGHRGHSNGPATYFTGLHGDVLVDVIRGGVSLEGGDGVDGSTAADTLPDIRLHGAQIGHGGYQAGHNTFGLLGSVRVHAEDDILLRSGTSRHAAVVIGHGGYASFGPMGQDGEVIEVVSRNGSLELDSTLAETASWGGTLIGHGAPNSTSGTRQGDILIDVAGEISLVGSYSQIGHRTGTSGGISNTDLTLRARSFDRVTGDSGSGLFHVDAGLGAVLTSSLATGHVSLLATGSEGLWLAGNIRQNSAFALNLLSTDDLYLTAHAINQGSGAVNLVAGWDPSVSSLSGGAPVNPDAAGIPRQYLVRDIDMDAEIFGTAGSYGANGGSVWVGASPTLAAADRAVMIASRTGQTNVAGSNVHIWGGALTGGPSVGERRFSQIGYNRREGGAASAATGRIRVGAIHDIEVISNKYEVGVLGTSGWPGPDHSGFVSYAQIGHGGDRDAVANMELTGEIVVEAGHDLIARGGKTRENYVLIGHGGYDNATSNSAKLGGDILVAVGNDLSLSGGQGSYSFAQIGHGGARHPILEFVASDITVTAGGNINVTGGPGGAGGSSNAAHARIGHGGYDAPVQASGSGFSGDIHVVADGTLTMLSGGTGSAYNYVQIGHGGVRSAGDHSGDICVIAGTGAILNAGSTTGSYGYAQIGHGGESSAGNHDGDVTVVSPDGSIALVGGNGTGRYAQIGHGGTNSGGDLGGDITVVADNGGDLSLAGGNANSSYAMVGHGDGGGATTGGTREGGMRLFAGGTLTATNGAGLFNTSILHQSNGGLAPGDYLGGNGFQLWANGGITLPDSALNGLNTMVNGNLASGPISLALANDIDLTLDGPDVSLDNADSFHLLIGGSLTMLSSYEQAGTGSITLVAGWDGSGATFSDGSVSYTGGDFCAPVIAEGSLSDFNTTGCDWFGNDAAGNGAGVLTIGSADQTDAVRIGTRLGGLVAAGHAVNLYGGSGAAAATQLGFHPGAVNQGADSNLELHVKAGGLLLQGGGGTGSYAQIGHGGLGSTFGNHHLGDITISFCEAGDVSVLGGGTQSYAQIGHGGLDLNSTQRGEIFIGGSTIGSQAGEILLQSGTQNYAYTQIGHGGGNISGSPYRGGDASGSVWIDSAGKVTVSAAGYGAYSQIGMGGLVNTNAHYGLDGDHIVVIAENGIEVSGGTAGWSYGQIGHGGYQSGGGSKNHHGDIYLNYNPDTGFAAGGGEITVSGRKGTSTGVLGATYAQIGHGGRNAAGTKRGNIVIGQSDAITLTGFGGQSYAQIGHGGNGSGPNYAASGSIDLNTSGLLQMNSGYGAEAYTLVGHGGYGNGGTANYGLAGESIAVTARAVEMRVGSDLGAFSQIGHGGYRITGTKTADISVTTLDGVFLNGRSGKGEAAHVQIGHGGYQSGGTVSGDISVLATSATSSITLQSGDEFYQHAQIGHGGRTSTGTKTGHLTVAAGGGGINVLGGGDSTDTLVSIDSFAQIGHGGSGSSGTITGDFTVTTSNGGDILLRGGADRYTHAQIGHGGRSSTGTQGGTVEVTADGAITLIASYDENKPGGTSNGTAGETYAQIGHGGMYGSGFKSGAIEVNAKTGILLRNGEANYGFTRIGHGGYDPGSGNNPATVIVDADIRVATESGGIVLDAYQTQAHDWNLVQIGHGGIYKGTTRSGAYLGDITVDAGSGGVSVLAGRGHASAAQIGHGGIGISGNHSGAIHVSGDGDLVMRTQSGGTGGDDRHYARIGHGGVSDAPGITMSGDLSGDICVTLGGSVLLDASVAQADASAVQIGHGGSAVKGDFDGKIVVVARGAGGVSLAGGPGVGTYAQIGHGGTDTDGTMTGHLHVIAETGDLTLAGGSGTAAYAMFGHGDGARSSLGQRGGGVHLFAQGNLTGTGGSGAAGEGNVFFFHQNDAGLQAADYLGGDGYQKVVNGSISLPAYASTDESTIINGNIGSGAIFIVDHSNTDYSFDSGDTFVNTSNDFYIVTGGNITVLNSYQNAGSGNVTLVAGWNGIGSTTPGSVTFNNGELCDPIISNPGLGIDFNDCESFGNGGAVVTLGSATQTAPVLIGSRNGTTTVAGHGLTLYGGNGTDGAATQIGFRPDGSGAVSGVIDIFLQGGGLTLQGGNAAGAYTQIGHGGTGATSATINARVTISFCEAGDVALTAGNGVGAYAHIGHGGNAWNGDRSGDIRLEGLGELSLTSGTTTAYTQIGHGGAAVETVYGAGSGTGSVFVEADGNVFLTGGGGANAYSQIGHGGGRQGGHFEGSVTLLSGGSVEARGGDGDTSSTQIGHGGRSASLSSIGPGDIRVEAAGDILLFSGTRDYSGSKIGHGNHNQKLSSFADSSVEVTAGRHIRLVSPQFDTFTNTLYAGTQIGHGGYSAIVGTVPSTQGYSGDLNVTAGGKLDLIAGKNGRSYLWSLIGHTSYYNSSGQHSGNITVRTGTVAGLDEYGVTLRGPSSDFAGANATSYYSFAAIGHRGHSNSTGTYSTGLSGDILVDAIRGGVTLESGNGLVTPDIRLHGAQIGHGGYAAGHLTYGLHGSVRVHAQDDILLRAGTSRYAAVVIGHGGSSSFGPMGGADEVIEVISREGALELDSTLASTTGGGVFIGHGSSNSTSGTRQGDILVDVAGEISLVGNLSTIGHRTSTSGGITNSDLTIRARSMDTASGDSGGGLLRIPSFLGASLTAHLNAGHVSLIGTGSEGIEIGAGIASNSAFDLNLLSRSHLTVLADLLNRGSGDIHLIAGWDPSLVPFHPAGETLPPAAGSPDYREYWIRDIEASPALLAAPDAYGNGDSILTIGSATQTAAVRVGTRLGDLVAAGHAVNLYAGASANTATQLGFHPGATGQGANGDIDLHVKSGGLLLQGGGGHYSYAQIGHGGNGSTDGNQHTGDISIHFAEQGDLALNGGSNYAYAQIGHGGLSLNATHSGAIDIGRSGTARVGEVSLNSGASYAYTQIGHGGGNVGGTTYKGGDANGSIWIDAAGKVTVSAAGQGAYSQIGMGGLVNSNGNYGLAGDRTVVIAENGIEISGGTTSWSYAQIGNGGYQSGGGSKSHQGDIYLNYNPDTDLAAGGGEIVLSGRKGTHTGQLSATYAQIGHGGRNAAGTKRGDIVIGQSDAITLTGFGMEAYAQIGHGGNGSGPNYAASGSIALNTSGLLRMDSGFGAEAYTLVGHGGYTSSAAGTTANYGLADESIAVTARAVAMTAGSDLAAFSQIGHGGYRITGTKTADIFVTTVDGISLHAGSGAGEAAYAQIGHGGYQSGGALSGDISTFASSASSTITLQAGEGLHQYAQIGHGGTSAGGSRSGSIDVAAIAGIELHGGTGDETTARIGHGGTGASGSAHGAVQVASAAHLLLGSGDGNGASAQIGHGGRLSTGATTGVIEAAAVLDIDLLGGNGLFSTTQIGHGGFGFGGSVTDQSIAVATAGALTLLGGASNVQIGHGGFGAQSYQLSGDIAVDSLGDLTITGGTGAFAYSQIGNLGMSSGSRLGGDITVLSRGDIDLTAVNGTGAAYAKIGHGHDFPVSLSAFSPVAEITGDILVGADANISLTDAMIGHLNAASSATMSAGETQIGVSLAAPADPSGGTLLADAQSEFHGADGLRFYLPQRSNNQIAAGASLNGATFPGAAPDPFDHQRDDEYTRNILGDIPQTPNEHDNLFGTGPAPGNAAGYAFYYDTITVVAGAGLPPETETPGGGDTTSSPIVLPVDTNPLLRWLGLLPDDRTFDDWLRDREKEFSRFGTFRILYENFEQYNPTGLSTFHLDGFPSGGEP